MVRGKFQLFSLFFCLEKRVFGSSSEVPQILPQLLSGAVDVGLNRAQGELHYFRYLVVRVILDVAEDDARPVLRPQLGNGLLDLAPQLARPR